MLQGTGIQTPPRPQSPPVVRVVDETTLNPGLVVRRPGPHHRPTHSEVVLEASILTPEREDPRVARPRSEAKQTRAKLLNLSADFLPCVCQTGRLADDSKPRD